MQSFADGCFVIEVPLQFIGSSKTKTYLADLKQVAKLSGKNYAEVLQEMMAQISESIAELHPADTAKTEEASEEQTITDPHKMAATSSPLLNPAPAPTLTPPASDIVKHLSHDLSADVYIKQLDSAYGTVQDGEELYAKFMDTLQNAGEKPSTYLQRLQVALSLAVSRGGVPEGDVKKHLLNQFCRGCWDNTLISELQLKQKKSSPPPFPELLLLLRTEEDREAAKVQRMKQHLGSTKQKVLSQAQFAYEEEEKGMCAALTTLTKQLTQQMAAIQQQLSALTAIQSQGQQSCAPDPVQPHSLVLSQSRPPVVQNCAGPILSRHVEENCSVCRVAASKAWATVKLPRGLVGSRCTAEIEVAGLNCHCLLDTELETYHCILSEHRVTNFPAKSTSSHLNLNFGDSPITSEWRERVTEKLNAIGEVFSHHDLDFGCTDRVKHHITLHDETPFKQRARPIHPQDIAAVRRHLRELLEAGVIRESTSPFSSPIVVVKKKNGDVSNCDLSWLCGYYRRFIKDYSVIAKPLNDLTRGQTPSRKPKSQVTAKSYCSPNLPFGERWDDSCQHAFERLIEKLSSAPVLGFADPALPYILHTDASTTGLGAALYQEQDGKLRVIAFASRGLSLSESRYPAHKLEFLALKWSVTEKFQDYLYGADFTVVTDSNPLTYILSSAKLDATGHRWLAALSTFSFKLLYRAGKHNYDADALSRRPHAISTEDSPKDHELIHQFVSQHLADADVIAPDVIDAICQSHLVKVTPPDDSCQIGMTLIESLSIKADALPESYISEDHLPVVPALSHSSLKEKQREDPSIRELIHQLETGEKVPPTARAELPELPLLLREWTKLELIDGVLYRKRQDNDTLSYQLVLPEDLRPFVLKSLHDDMGHLGIDRTLDLVRARFYWPRMASDVEQKVKTCGRCVRRKSLPERSAPLVNITTSRPLELLCMDFLSLEPDSSNTRDILVLTDHFTKFAVAIPTPNQKARTVAKCLWDNFIVYYGIPDRIHTDQGQDFESKLIKELCEVAGIQKSRTTPYHPRGNPVERFNRTLLSMLGTLEEKQKSKWKDYVKPLVHAYNCTKNDVTGYAPYELMFGRTPRLPVDMVFGLPLQGTKHKSHSQYVQHLKSRLEESFKIASENALKSAERNKTRFDQRIIPAALEVEDRVLVRNVRLRGKHKLSDKWEHDIFVVVSRAGELPVYKVKPENKDGPLRTLHRDLLLPCGFLPASEESETACEEVPAARPRTRQHNPDPVDSTDYVGSDEELEIVAPLQHNSPAVRFTVEKGRPVPVASSPAKESCPPTLSSVSPVFSAVESEEESSVEEDLAVEAVDENLPADLPELNLPEAEDILTILPADEDPPEESIQPVATAVEPPVATDIVDSDSIPRRSTRQRLPPDRLQYTARGKPFISVVQTLLHSLSDILGVSTSDPVVPSIQVV
ncbi:hypothetical protein WMY93_001283 [Mugilogobius chulae]|uniref:Gypsy retrotransposon integrase-like protein 1 n=1 Tax=Mugilogobius chulae TaxID=88201 RepID=A0AAW0Q4V8_9GOBI